MHRLLLDSQVALWLVTDNPKLSERARQMILEADQLYVSVASMLEFTIKAMLGKLELPAEFEHELFVGGIRYLDVTTRHATGIVAFPTLVQHDPFDRLLLSQAKIEGLKLLTADRLLIAGGHGFVVSAR